MHPPRYIINPFNPDAEPIRVRRIRGKALSLASLPVNSRLAAHIRDSRFVASVVENRLMPMQVTAWKRQLEINPDGADAAALRLAAYDLRGELAEVNDSYEETEKPKDVPFGKHGYTVGRCTEFLSPGSYIEQYTCPYRKAKEIVDEYETEENFLASWELMMEILEVGEKRELVVPKEWLGEERDLTIVLDEDCFRLFWNRAMNRARAMEMVRDANDSFFRTTEGIVERGTDMRMRTNT